MDSVTIKEKVITVKKSTTNYTEQLDNAFRDIDTQERLNLSGKIVLQLNAVKSSEHALFDTEGSQYINEIVQAVTKPWECTCCKNTSILSNHMT
ncbi:hypothetical protein MAR_003142 [Mya arenaria]|uniref:Uncharacterized protein n=1 Tax=Mya arenaria TaxID=6604 RepID=A0ABY7G875_MYAAR|nr:hypothetical protein MAR_003142 [Mya arenaria]